MSTYYTHPVCEGTVTSLREFMLNCARAVGYYVTLRDEAGGPIDQFDLEKLVAPRLRNNEQKFSAQLAELEGMSDEEAGRRAQAELQRRLAERREAAEEAAQRRARCEAMLGKVRACACPSKEHAQLWKFCEEQLADTILLERDLEESPIDPEKYTARAWKERQAAFLRRQIESEREDNELERELAARRRAYTEALLKALDRAEGTRTP
jgi:hypothetical protein